jgi:hypothetical protein
MPDALCLILIVVGLSLVAGVTIWDRRQYRKVNRQLNEMIEKLEKESRDGR